MARHAEGVNPDVLTDELLRADDVAAFLELLEVANGILGTIEQLLRDAETGLTAKDWDVLALAHAMGPSRPTEILRRVVLTNRAQTLSSILDRLEGKGLVVRSPHPQDGRSVLVAVTGEGRRTVERVFPVLARGVIRPFSSRYSTDDLATLRGLLRRSRSGHPTS